MTLDEYCEAIILKYDNDNITPFQCVKIFAFGMWASCRLKKDSNNE
jgi:hypothetical protein